MKLSELVQKSRIEVKAEQKPVAPASSPAPRRRYFWDEDNAQQPEQTTATTETKAETPALGVSSALDKKANKPKAVSQALDSRELAVKSAEETPLVQRESGVSSALDNKSEKTKPVRQPFATPLDVRELGVRKNENSALDVGLLVGKEKNLVLLACEECRKIGSLETNYISTDELKVRVSIDSNGLRNLIHRVKEKGFFEVEAKQLGRNGLRKFKIPQSVYQQFLNSPLDSRESGVSSAVVQPLGTALETAPCSSSSLKDLNNTTTTEDTFWLNIPDNLKGQIQIGQMRAMVKAGTIDLETLQDSIWGFAHDLEKNLVRSKNNNPLAILIGSLKNGGYISQQFHTQKQAELREVQSRAEDLKKMRAEIEAQNLAEEFEKFRQEFPEKAEALKPINNYLKNFDTGSMGYKLWLEEFKQSQKSDKSI